MLKKVIALSVLALSTYITPCYALSNYEEMESRSKNAFYEPSQNMVIPEEAYAKSARAGMGIDPNPAYLDAQELRLKARELTSQLLESWYPQNIKGMVAYITTFTPQDDMNAESAFGQYLRQAFMYEFNQRGFAVRDFSARNLIVNENGNAYGISDNKYKTSVLRSNAALVVGTFYRDLDYLFINVRLVRGSDGMVLRTGQTIIPVTPLVARMTKKPKTQSPLPSVPINIVSGE